MKSNSAKADSEIQSDVINELRWDPAINETSIGVSVKDGIVTLSGHVDSFAEKFLAERAAKRVYAVKAVANELDVRLPGSNIRSDTDIAADAVAALRSNILVPDDKITVTVSKGWVKLEGDVTWQFQKDAAEKAVRYLVGVTGVSNLIKVNPHVSPVDVKARIQEALRRAAESDARRVDVEVEGSKVILKGTVRSCEEEKEAERAAWSAPGVRMVENHLAVSP